MNRYVGVTNAVAYVIKYFVTIFSQIISEYVKYSVHAEICQIL